MGQMLYYGSWWVEEPNNSWPSVLPGLTHSCPGSSGTPSGSLLTEYSPRSISSSLSSSPPTFSSLDSTPP